MSEESRGNSITSAIQRPGCPELTKAPRLRPEVVSTRRRMMSKVRFSNNAESGETQTEAGAVRGFSVAHRLDDFNTNYGPFLL